MRREKTLSKDDAQIHTLEGFAAAVLIVFAMFYAVQTVGITPTSSSTASQDVETTLSQVTSDLLTQAKSNGNLKTAILDWKWNDSKPNVSSPTWNESSERNAYYESTTCPNLSPPQPCPPTSFGDTLKKVLSDNGRAFNIWLVYEKPDGTVEQTEFIYQGTPTDNAVTSTQVVVINDNDEFPDGTEIGNIPPDKAPFPEASKAISDSRLYNVVKVKLVTWRI